MKVRNEGNYMKCKFCLAELEEDVTVCPLCGKELKETEEECKEAEGEYEYAEDEEYEDEEEVVEVVEKKRKKMPKALKICLSVFGGLLLAAALAVAVMCSMDIKISSVGAFLGFTEADVNYKNNYSVSDKKLEKKADQVIAQVGDQSLTNEQLQVYYWISVRDFVSNYYYYLNSMGLDVTKPLDEQIYDEKTGQTWQQYFLENTLETWHRYASLTQEAQDSGHELSDEILSYLDTYEQEMNKMAVEDGFTDAEAMIDESISKGSSLAACYNYMRTEYTALYYLQSKEDELIPTEQDIEDYYTANKETMESKGYGKDAGKYYDVRHIFITVEGDMTQLENGTYGYTEAQWEACREKAQKMLDDFLANNPTEEKFAELAKKHSEDPGSASNGGLYSGLTKKYGFIQEFEDWYVDESRQVGDTGLVKNTGSTKVGYHVMYFSGSQEIWKTQAATMAESEKVDALIEKEKAKYPITKDYKKIVLGEADISTDA